MFSYVGLILGTGDSVRSESKCGPCLHKTFTPPLLSTNLTNNANRQAYEGEVRCSSKVHNEDRYLTYIQHP